MNRVLSIVFCVVIYQISFSQVNRIIYRAEVNFSKIGKNLERISDENKKIIEKLKNKNESVYCFLDFNKTESVFHIEDKMPLNSSIGLKLTKIKVGKGVFFTNMITSEVINQKNSFGSDFKVVYPKSKWNITQQTKTIGKFICYKATTQIEAEGRWGKKIVPVIAWFTQELPYRFGPKQFSGLPGVILELTEGGLTFYAQKIKFNQIFLKLKEKNKKGEIITLTEFNLMAKKMLKR